VRGRGAALAFQTLLYGVLTAAISARAATPDSSFSATPSRDLRARIQRIEDRILIATTGALHRFQPETETWTFTTTADGLPGTPLTGLSLTDENVWVLGEGLSVSDARFDDWQFYAPEIDVPGRFVNAVGADDDYAYAGTDAGAARFDRYILEWEPLLGPDGKPLGSVSDVIVGDDRVWFGLANGIAEYRKDAESIRVDTALGALESPQVLALRQTPGFVWALTSAGVARYDKSLETWTGYRAGAEFPSARVHQLTLRGDDLWLGTDAGLWHFTAETGIWRRHESGDEMPGERVLAFALETDRIWVVTERAFAVWEVEAARWVDFSAVVPLAPNDVTEMYSEPGTLILLGPERIVYGLARGQTNPSLFIYRSEALLTAAAEPEDAASTWRVGLDQAGLGLRRGETTLHLKGGATVFIENDPEGKANDSGLGELLSETRWDIALSGRTAGDRTLSGFYDTTDPDNAAYQLTYRGARSDVLRVVSVGEIEQQLFNSELAPGTGLRGGRVRAELGERSEATRRRLLSGDLWVGERRTLPGRDVFYGGNRSVSGRLPTTAYVRAQVFPAPSGWSADDLAQADLYRDDGLADTDDANTEYRTLAGRDGAWDRLRSNADYVLGARGETLILASPLGTSEALVAVRSGLAADEVDLGDMWLRNHYLITSDPVPGSLTIAIADSSGATADGTGRDYLEVFRLDADGDGHVDPEHFSPLTGLLAFPDARPFPDSTYADDDPVSVYSLEYSYQASLNTYRLSHADIVPDSERITLDRVPLRADVDYSLLPTSGLFIFFEHVLLDEDSVVEIEYQYEVDSDDAEGVVLGGQFGFAPQDNIYCGLNSTHWRDEEDRDVTTTDLNARLEWKAEQHLLRVTPELAVSSATAASGSEGGTGQAAGIGLQGRYRRLEISASHRNLGADYVSAEDRRTLAGRLREESRASARLDVSRQLQAELEWDKSLSDRDLAAGGAGFVAADSLGTGRGEESLLMGSIRLLRAGLPNLELRRGRVLVDADGRRQEKWVSRAELEVSPDQAGYSPLGIDRLWLRAFFQRSERETAAWSGSTTEGAAADETGTRTTDHAFARLNGSVGSPFAWNVAFEDRRARFQTEDRTRDVRRFQEIDATLQSVPHSSLEAFLRWEADRDVFHHPAGGDGGFSVRRVLLTTVHLYPGRLWTDLSRLSFRFDVGRNETERGEPGVPLPDAGSLFRESRDASQRTRSRNGIIEARIQLLSWLRIVERWESETDRRDREGLASEGTRSRLENRVELRPTGGTVVLRAIGMNSDEAGTDVGERRFSGQWDQTWGRGWLTFLSLDAERTESRNRNVGDLRHLWNPLAQITWRRTRWQLDATLGGSLTWERSEDVSVGATESVKKTRRQALTTSLSVRPLPVATLKLEYGLNRNEVGPATENPAPAPGWETSHDLRLRLQFRV
jgi:hypothetical protein